MSVRIMDRRHAKSAVTFARSSARSRLTATMQTVDRRRQITPCCRLGFEFRPDRLMQVAARRQLLPGIASPGTEAGTVPAEEEDVLPIARAESSRETGRPFGQQGCRVSAAEKVGPFGQPSEPREIPGYRSIKRSSRYHRLTPCDHALLHRL
jgi:hypothetical protein